ncbi:MAG: DinB family protein, partial [Planctomycetota bacterium]
NADYAAALLADVDEAQMIAQPDKGTNHPAWLLSHMNAYHPLIADLLRGQTPDDPIDHPFGMKSSPVANASVYAAKDELLGTWSTGHEDVAAALSAATDETLARPMPLSRMAGRFPTVGASLVYLMARHESLHLGQLSTWRRGMHLPRV